MALKWCPLGVGIFCSKIYEHGAFPPSMFRSKLFFGPIVDNRNYLWWWMCLGRWKLKEKDQRKLLEFLAGNECKFPPFQPRHLPLLTRPHSPFSDQNNLCSAECGCSLLFDLQMNLTDNSNRWPISIHVHFNQKAYLGNAFFIIHIFQIQCFIILIPEKRVN